MASNNLIIIKNDIKGLSAAGNSKQKYDITIAVEQKEQERLYL